MEGKVRDHCAQSWHTQHIALLVLPAWTTGNVGLDTQVDDGQVPYGVVFRVNSSNDGEASAIVDLPANLFQLWPKAG